MTDPNMTELPSNLVTHPACGTRFRQRGNQTGHCGACHHTFASGQAFAFHQRMIGERSVCLDPSTVTKRDGSPMYLTKHDGFTEVWAYVTNVGERALTAPWALPNLGDPAGVPVSPNAVPHAPERALTGVAR
jgi:hypothetical protein